MCMSMVGTQARVSPRALTINKASGRCRGWCACTPAIWRTSRKPPLATLWPCLAWTAPLATASQMAQCGAPCVRATPDAPGVAEA